MINKGGGKKLTSNSAEGDLCSSGGTVPLSLYAPEWGKKLRWGTL